MGSFFRSCHNDIPNPRCNSITFFARMPSQRKSLEFDRAHNHFRKTNYRYHTIVSSICFFFANKIITYLAFFFAFSLSCSFSFFYSLPNSLTSRCFSFSSALSVTFIVSLFLSYSLDWTHTREVTVVCTCTYRSIHGLWCLQVSHTKLAHMLVSSLRAHIHACTS